DPRLARRRTHRARRARGVPRAHRSLRRERRDDDRARDPPLRPRRTAGDQGPRARLSSPWCTERLFWYTRSVSVTWQASLRGPDEPGFGPWFAVAARRFLGDGAWVDVVPGWASGAGALFGRVMDSAPWGAHDRWMYDRMVAEPRLTTREWTDPPPP